MLYLWMRWNILTIVAISNGEISGELLSAVIPAVKLVLFVLASFSCNEVETSRKPFLLPVTKLVPSYP